MKHHIERVKKVATHKHTIKVSQILITFSLLFLLLYVSYDIRSTTADLPIADRAAQDNVVNQLRQSIVQQVEMDPDSRFLPPARREQIIQERFEQEWSQNRDFYESQIDIRATQFRFLMQDEINQTYLIGLDPFYYFRWFRNTLENGHPGDYISEEGFPATNHRLAPTEIDVSAYQTDMLVQIAVAWHRFVNIFRDVPPQTSFFFVPIVLMTITLTIAFFLGKRLGGNFAGVFTAGIIMLNQNLLPRSIAGFTDTDPFNVLFPLLIMWMLVEATFATKTWSRYLFVGLGGLATGLFAIAWNSWWFMFAIVGTAFAVSCIFYAVKVFIQKRKIIDVFYYKRLQQNIIMGVGYFISTAFFVTILTSFSTFTRAFTKPFASTGGINAPTHANGFPNVFTTVAELADGSWSLIFSVGGSTAQGLVFLLALIGAILLIVPDVKKKWFDQDYNVLLPALLIVYFAFTAYMVLVAVRFTILYAPAFAVGFGIFVGRFYQFLHARVPHWISMPLWPITGAFILFTFAYFFGGETLYFGLAILVLVSGFLASLQVKQLKIPTLSLMMLLLLVPVMSGETFYTDDSKYGVAVMISQSMTPMMNTDFYQLLTRIRDESHPDAIISSWWDFGHQFITIGRRGASADGANQNTIAVNFLAQALITDDPSHFNGISRMLNCNSHFGFIDANDIVNDSARTMELFGSILRETDMDVASQILLDSGYFTPEQVTNITAQTHCDDIVESYWIASEDMVGKAPVWGHFGTWDFNRAQLWNERNNRSGFITLAMEIENITEAEAAALQARLRGMNNQQGNAWISPWPQFYTQGRCQIDGNATICPIQGMQLGQGIVLEGVVFETPQDATLIIRQAGQQILIEPSRVGYNIGMDFFLYDNEESPVPEIGLNIINKNGQTSVSLAHPALVGSTFTKMFYYDGAGLQEYVEIFDDRIIRLNGQRFITFKRTDATVTN